MEEERELLKARHEAEWRDVLRQAEDERRHIDANVRQLEEAIGLERIARLRAEEESQLKEADLARERVRRLRAEEEAQTVVEQAAALREETQQTDSKRETRSDTEMRALKEERDRLRHQFDQMVLHHHAAEDAAQKARTAQREIEAKAADDRREFEHERQKQKSEYDMLVQESARVGLKTTVGMAPFLEPNQYRRVVYRESELHRSDRLIGNDVRRRAGAPRTKNAIGFEKATDYSARGRDDRPTRGEPRYVAETARSPSPVTYSKAPNRPLAKNNNGIMSFPKSEPLYIGGDLNRAASVIRANRPRRAAADARPANSFEYRRALDYSDADDDGANSEIDDDVTNAKQRLEGEGDKTARPSPDHNPDNIAAPIAPVETNDNTTPRERSRPVINDAAVAPKHYEGSTIADAGTQWLQYFTRYREYKGLNNEDACILLKLLQRGDAASWLDTLSADELKDFDKLEAAFKSSFCPSKQLVWLHESNVWKEEQKCSETVELYVTRVTRAARRVNMTDESLNNAIIQGLRPPIRMAVLQQGIKGLKETIHAAKIAEASLVTDPATALLMESVKNQTAQVAAMLEKVTAVAQAQAKAAQAPVRPPELKTATEQSTQPTEQTTSGGGQRGGGRGNWRGGGRQLRNTPKIDNGLIMPNNNNNNSSSTHSTRSHKITDRRRQIDSRLIHRKINNWCGQAVINHTHRRRVMVRHNPDTISLAHGNSTNPRQSTARAVIGHNSSNNREMETLGLVLTAVLNYVGPTTFALRGAWSVITAISSIISVEFAAKLEETRRLDEVVGRALRQRTVEPLHTPNQSLRPGI